MIPGRKQYSDDRLEKSEDSAKIPEKVFRQTITDLRDDGGYELDDQEQERFYHHMMSARHKFMSSHHKRQSYSKK